MTRVLIVRGHLANPWELRPWEDLPDRFEVAFLKTGSNGYDTSGLGLDARSVSALRDRLPSGRLGEVVTGIAGDRYLEDANAAFEWADVVHAEELGFWFAADAARRRIAGGDFQLVQTVWETLPLGVAFRNRSARRYRGEVLAGTDLFLPATERARLALLLEGVADDRMRVCSPGIDTERFASAAASAAPPGGHVILSPGRLVWEKGHQDAIRALALIHRGIAGEAKQGSSAPRLLIVGNGPERKRLQAYAGELGVGAYVDFASVPYDEMPSVFASASCLLLGSLPVASAGYHPFDIPRTFWEEQFGMVFAEAMASGLPIITTTSGAIPEVLRGSATLVAPGDWPAMAEALAAGPLARPPGARMDYPPELLEYYSATAAAERLVAVYDSLALSP